MPDPGDLGEDMGGTAAERVAAPATTSMAEAQKRLDVLAASGAAPSEFERFLAGVFTERNRSIRNTDFQRLDPRTVIEDYLKPRAELYRFVVVHWIRLIFLPSLKPRVAEELFMFGLGRLFSSYNDLGCQHCTDVDLNIVAADRLSKADMDYLARSLGDLKRRMHELFGIVLEIDPAYTILKAREITARLAHENDEVREANARFYKSNERSINVIKDHAEIRESIFSLVRAEPDCRLFENFLGFESGSQSYAKLRAGSERLRIVHGRGGAASVIGSKPFDDYCRSTFTRKHFLSPPDWVFSMKYFVNRVYDYVGAMRCQGYSLEKIGFDEPVPGEGRKIPGDRRGPLDEARTSQPDRRRPPPDRREAPPEIDLDYRYLRNAHKLMLYLQELITMTIGSYSAESDYSYISRARFLRFMELGGEKFGCDFEDMVLNGDLLYQSAKERYKVLRHRIKTKARDRFLTGKASEFSLLPPDLACELVYRDSHDYKICVPYSWGDLGFFVFSSIASRIAKIVDERLVPRLTSFGMSENAMRRYSERLG